MLKQGSEQNAKILMDTATRKKYRFDNMKLMKDFGEYATGCRGVEDAYQKIAEQMGYAWETTKNHIMYGKMPNNLDTVKKYGQVIAGDAYAYLTPLTLRKFLQADEAEVNAPDDMKPDSELADFHVSAQEAEKYIPCIKEIFRMLYDVLSLYEVSECYNYIPGTEDLDGAWNYFDRMMINIRKEASARFLGERDSAVYRMLARIIDETDFYIKSYSIPGVVPRWRKINRDINYFDCVFDAIETYSYEEVRRWQTTNKYVKFWFFPTKEDIALRRQYFAEKDEKNNNDNLRYSRDRYFQNELLVTLEKVFEHDFWGK